MTAPKMRLSMPESTVGASPGAPYTVWAKAIAVITALFALGLLPASAQDTGPANPVPVEEQELENVEDIVTEEQSALNAVNYKAPPETEDIPALVTFDQLRYASEIDMNRALSAVEEGLQNCIDRREVLEQRISLIQAPGPRTIHAGWLRAYNACVIQRHKDIRTVGQAIEARRMDIIASGEDEGATMLTGMIDRLVARQSQIKRAISAEMDMVPPLFAYYNTGVKAYTAGASEESD